MINPQQIREVASIMRDLGVATLKIGDLEMSMANVAYSPKQAFFKAQDPEPPAITPEEEKEIKHKLEEMTSVMNMEDEKILDRFFPAEENTGVDQ